MRMGKTPSAAAPPRAPTIVKSGRSQGIQRSGRGDRRPRQWQVVRKPSSSARDGLHVDSFQHLSAVKSIGTPPCGLQHAPGFKEQVRDGWRTSCGRRDEKRARPANSILTAKREDETRALRHSIPSGGPRCRRAILLNRTITLNCGP